MPTLKRIREEKGMHRTRCGHIHPAARQQAFEARADDELWRSVKGWQAISIEITHSGERAAKSSVAREGSIEAVQACDELAWWREQGAIAI